MNVIVSDTSPLSMLLQVGCIEVLPRLFQQVLLPEIVLEELNNPASPVELRTFVEHLPDWITLKNPINLCENDDIDPGELAAISLAIEQNTALLIDDLQGRSVAAAMGVRIIESIGVLLDAANAGFIDNLAEIHKRIRNGRYRINESILIQTMQSHEAFKAGIS